MKKIIFTIPVLMQYFLINAQVYEFKNGNWWQNNQFIKKTIYTNNGKFSFVKPEKIDSSIDLTGKYCIPPFGDAHTHNLADGRGLKEMVTRYLDEGVFYVQVLGNYGEGANIVRPILEKSKKLEATYANGLLTCTYGHGFYPYEPLAMGIYSPQLQYKYYDSVKKSRRAENRAYFFFDSITDVDLKWDLVMKDKPDHIKIVLMDAENYTAKRIAEKADDNGLSPEVAAYIVKKAHALNLRVFAHVETANDARLCAQIGVDVLAHLPGYGWNGKKETASKNCITNADVLLFKKTKLSVIPTFNIDHTTTYDSKGKATENLEAAKNLLNYQIKTLRSMIKNKVPVLLGGDYYGNTVRPEIDRIIKYKMLSPAELITMWGTTTPQSIFPNRKLGLIKDSYEASFLVLNENPLTNINSIFAIQQKVKQGIILSYGK
jgi:imidazolonepropionase-like amidohydrolase